MQTYPYRLTRRQFITIKLLTFAGHILAYIAALTGLALVPLAAVVAASASLRLLIILAGTAVTCALSYGALSVLAKWANRIGF